jgi:hypothetical protein
MMASWQRRSPQYPARPEMGWQKACNSSPLFARLFDEGRGRSFERGRFVKPKAGDRVRTAAGLEGEVLFVNRDRTTACVELDGSTDEQTVVYRLDELIRIDEGDKKRKR